MKLLALFQLIALVFFIGSRCAVERRQVARWPVAVAGPIERFAEVWERRCVWRWSRWTIFRTAWRLEH